jgi:hypothetical protein
MDNLTLKYRPSTLGEVRGHPAVVEALKSFAANPYPAALLFFGESGVGKTVAARALALDLGVAVHEQELGGWSEIPSGEMSAEEVRHRFAQLRYVAMFGSGWKVLVCNEADRMSKAAETIWLDALEHLPPRTVIVFTTNEPERLSRRFRDRCENYHFGSDREELQPHIQALARQVWAYEVGDGEPPDLDTLGMPTLGDEACFAPSFRLALQQLARLVRAHRAGGTAAVGQARGQALFDNLPAGEAEAVCPYCERKLRVRTGTKRVKCNYCKKTAELDLCA